MHDGDARPFARALLSFLGPLIIWLMKKDESAFVNDQGKEALNFQLTLLIAQVVAVGVASATCGILFFCRSFPGWPRSFSAYLSRWRPAKESPTAILSLGE